MPRYIDPDIPDMMHCIQLDQEDLHIPVHCKRFAVTGVAAVDLVAAYIDLIIAGRRAADQEEGMRILRRSRYGSGVRGPAI